MNVIGDIPRRSAKVYGQKECIVFEGKRLTYKQLDERVNRLANYLLSLDIKGTKHIAVLAENCPQLILVFFASAKSGFVIVPLNYRL